MKEPLPVFRNKVTDRIWGLKRMVVIIEDLAPGMTHVLVYKPNVGMIRVVTIVISGPNVTDGWWLVVTKEPVGLSKTSRA